MVGMSSTEDVGVGAVGLTIVVNRGTVVLTIVVDLGGCCTRRDCSAAERARAMFSWAATQKAVAAMSSKKGLWVFIVTLEVVCLEGFW